MPDRRLRKKKSFVELSILLSPARRIRREVGMAFAG
jgi:hypothetical protein